MDDTMDQQPAPRERVGSRAWVRTVGVIGGGLMAGGILVGTMTAANAASDGTTATPSTSQEEVTPAPAAADGTTEDVAAADCPEGGGGADPGTVPDSGTTPDGGTESESDSAG
jgi:hypothetical protein